MNQDFSQIKYAVFIRAPLPKRRLPRSLTRILIPAGAHGSITPSTTHSPGFCFRDFVDIKSDNILAFQAIATAPNPALPVAIINASSALAFLAIMVCATILPKWFDHIRFDTYHFIGIVLTVIGVALIALKR